MSKIKQQDSLVSSMEVGSLGVLHLKRLWSRVTAHRVLGLMADPKREWTLDRVVMHGLGLALEETLQYLAQSRPTYADFEEWILRKNEGSLDHEIINRINSAIAGRGYSDSVPTWLQAIENTDPVLSLEDLMFWQENGYVKVPEAVPQEQCKAAEQAIWEFIAADPGHPETWYGHIGRHGIMVQLFHHPALAANRQSPRVHKAFAQIWGTADLWMTIDRVSFNPPERGGWYFPSPYLHWDTTLKADMPLGVSGLLYLTDTAADQGAFRCVPRFHHRIPSWLEERPANRLPSQQDLEQLGAVPIAGQRGDLIIWHHSLPHGSGPNSSDRPRIVQYMKMYPM
jgi:hypothetical protein